MRKYDQFNVNTTPQSEEIPGRDMVENNAGGFVFKLDKWAQLDRFLILGAESSTYYSGKRALVLGNAKVSLKCLAEDGKRFVDRVVQVSHEGLAAKNDQAVFLMALACTMGSEDIRPYAFKNLPKVARFSTPLFHFVAYREQVGGGWGRGMSRAVEDWYLQKGPEWLARQVSKYRQRDGWSHGDLLRLSHIKAPDEEYRAIFRYILGKEGAVDALSGTPALEYLAAVESLKGLSTSAQDQKTLLKLVEEHRMPMEVIPTDLRSEGVYRLMMQNYGMTALLRNLGNLGKKGILEPGNWDDIIFVCGRLTDEEAIRKGRLHPLNIMTALWTYKSGRSMKGSGTWEVVPEVREALEDAFFSSFGNVTPAGKRTMLALDVSGSMGAGTIGGSPLNPREASAAMMMVTRKTEPMTMVTAFTSSGGGGWWNNSGGGADALSPLDIGRATSIDETIKKVSGLPFGATDCAAPMLWALREKKEFDTFVVYTDNETWAGNAHPCQALQRYRKEMGIPARLIVVGMTATEFSIADPEDGGMMDVVGFDSSAPALMNAFSRGEI